VTVALDPLLKSILDASVGQVESTLSKVLECNVYLDIIEQNQISGTNFVRKITITVKDLPVIRAVAKFDSKILPEQIMTELLRRKEGIGTILTKNKIKAEREIVSLDFKQNGKEVIRKYRIVSNKSVWFEILEEIRLDYITACKNG
jgi:chorismate-pyruvate lyase